MNQGLIMQKLINSVQNYAWGSKTALTDLYGIANPDNLPMAELWMGAHPKSSSKIEDASGQVRSLRDVIDADKAALLGDKVREFSEIISLLQPVAGAHNAIAHFLESPNAEALSELFASLLNMQGEEKSHALAVLKAALNSQQGEPWDTIRVISTFYPDDSGLFSPLLLNVVKLNPGEAMFLFAETPHAYLNGVALEVMANSDNVLRAGLTPKYIDIPELVANVKFVAKPAAELLTQPVKNGAELDFPIPVDDFAFSLHDLSADETAIAQESAAILFCVEGEATLHKDSERLVLKPGESAFVAANESPVRVSGTGRLARVFNKL